MGSRGEVGKGTGRKKEKMVSLVHYLLCLVFCCVYGQSYHQYQDDGTYSYSYLVEDVSSGTKFGHSEQSLADRGASGSYHVLLPDGRLQTVHYTVQGAGGFQASVQYEAVEGVREESPFPAGSQVNEVFLPAANSVFYSPPQKPTFRTYIPQSYEPAPVTGNAFHEILNPLIGRKKHKYQNTTGSKLDLVKETSLKNPLPLSRRTFEEHRSRPNNYISRIKTYFKNKEVHSKKQSSVKHELDPYLLSEEELKGRTFDDPFFYPKHRKIMKKARKEHP